jgi:DNA-binding winged helix-turn-helix (wHTH) protein
MRLCFGEYVFDSATRQVLREGDPLPLSPKAFQLLEALLEARPRVLPRSALQDLLWPRTFVSETSLPRLVSELRKALGDDPSQPRFVRTVHGFGYAFSGQAAEEGAPAEPLMMTSRRSNCRLLVAGGDVPLAEGENLVGRGLECTVRVLSPGVSRRHARVVVSEGGATLEDLGSKNGTYLHGRQLVAPVELADGDEIAMGAAVFVFRGPAALASTKTTSRR